MTLDEWVDAVCKELAIEVPPSKAVLDFARDVAHRVDRPAAPLTCLLVGLAAASTADLNDLMDRVRALLPPDTSQAQSSIA
jgi:hypothetical protein